MDGILLTGCGYPLNCVVDIMNVIYGPQISKFQKGRIHREMEGIVAGCRAAGYKEMTMELCVFWNTYYSFDYVFPLFASVVRATPSLKRYRADFPTNESTIQGGGGGSGGSGRAGDRCTGFIATGRSATASGGFVIAHNTFDTYCADGAACNVILEIKPTDGAAIMMQSPPGCISSGTDFYMSDWGDGRGFVCTETTFGGFHRVDAAIPICCRIRHAVQFSRTLDDFVKILKVGNGGDYANAWLIADRKTNEIMRIELGNRHVSVERKRDGYFIGFNAPYDERIRNLECTNTGFNDIRRHQGARHVRLEQLMTRHRGKLTAAIAKTILADHYDVYLERENPCSRTCCSHYDLDDRAFMSDPSRPLPFQPLGAVDGMVCDAQLSSNGSFTGRWGSSCGTAFVAKTYLKKNPQWMNLAPFLVDRPTRPWSVFRMGGGAVVATKRRTVRRRTARRRTTTRRTDRRTDRRTTRSIKISP